MNVERHTGEEIYLLNTSRMIFSPSTTDIHPIVQLVYILLTEEDVSSPGTFKGALFVVQMPLAPAEIPLSNIEEKFALSHKIPFSNR